MRAARRWVTCVRGAADSVVTRDGGTTHAHAVLTAIHRRACVAVVTGGGGGNVEAGLRIGGVVLVERAFVSVVTVGERAGLSDEGNAQLAFSVVTGVAIVRDDERG